MVYGLRGLHGRLAVETASTTEGGSATTPCHRMVVHTARAMTLILLIALEALAEVIVFNILTRFVNISDV